MTPSEKFKKFCLEKSSQPRQNCYDCPQCRDKWYDENTILKEDKQ